jgi:hypothetical protein
VLLRWISFAEIAKRHGEVYDLLCDDLLRGYFLPNMVRYVPPVAGQEKLTVERFREIFPGAYHDPLFISQYLDGWHLYWLEYERWRIDHRFPHVGPPPITAPATAPETPTLLPSVADAPGGRLGLPSWFVEQAPLERPKNISQCAKGLLTKWSRLPEATREQLAEGCKIDPLFQTVRNHLQAHYGSKKVARNRSGQ